MVTYISSLTQLKGLLVSIRLHDLGILHANIPSLGNFQLALVESFSLNLSLSLKSSNNILVFPANLMTKSAQRTKSPSMFQSQDLQSRWNHHFLLPVVWRRNTFKCLQALECILSALGLVRSHASDSPPENLGRSTEVERSTLGENVATLSQEVKILQLISVEVSRHIDLLTPDNHHLVAGKNELGYDGSEAAQHMAPAINDNGFG